jgi:uncharacterized membrane protein
MADMAAMAAARDLDRAQAAADATAAANSWGGSLTADVATGKYLSDSSLALQPTVSCRAPPSPTQRE